jgi:hypothetical protein
MEKNKRELYINLLFAGNDPDIAFLHNSKYTINEYEAALNEDPYQKFKADTEKRFLSSMDSVLLGNLYRAKEAMMLIGEDHKNYPQIQKNYIEMLKLTQPIIERLNRQRLEVQSYDGLEIVIEGDDAPVQS